MWWRRLAFSLKGKMASRVRQGRTCYPSQSSGTTNPIGATTPRLYSLLGPARSKEIVFTARLIEAPEALAIGLVSEVLPEHDALHARATELARLVASHAPLTLRATKEAFRRIKERSLADGDTDKDLILSCYMSEDFREGMDAFLTKRKPVWKGR